MDATASAAARPALLARRGFDPAAPFRHVTNGELHGEELDRFEVRTGASTGYLRVGGVPHPLPIGSRLDPATGTFTWAPGVGFVGAYDFVFDACAGSAEALRYRDAACQQPLRIVLHPKGSLQRGSHVMIDTPSADAIVPGRFTVAGWALDLDDGVGTGVTTVHVWAYPVDPFTGQRIDPMFLGVADYGGPRRDVAAAFGDSYVRTGYGLTVDSLAPGTYDLAVFAWSNTRLSVMADALTSANQALLAETRRQNALAISNRIPVRIQSASPGVILGLLAARGDTIANTRDDVIEAYVDPATLLVLSAHQAVGSVREIHPPQPMEVIGQGREAHNASPWIQAGVTGAGVKLGIIDTGFAGISALLGVELPVSVIARCYTEVGAFTNSISDCNADSNPHGTAVAETALDIAPGAQLYISNPRSPLDLRLTVEWMADNGVHVINHSVGWTWDGPGDGTSPDSDSPLRSVDYAVAAGMVFVAAAGNSQQETWFGPPTFNGVHLLEFAPAQDFNNVYLTAGQQITLLLRWQDPWGGSLRDLDLWLTTPSLEPLATSVDIQDGGPADVPMEGLTFTAGASGFYRIYIDRFDFADNEPLPAWIQLQGWGTGGFQFITGAGISNPAESANPGLLAVGAAAWNTNTTIAPYSNLGPTPDGRVKPDIVGAADTDTVTDLPMGDPSGTSQASAHVAGLAALVRHAYPAWTPAQVATFLKQSASPRDVVPNSVWGHGFARLPSLCSYTVAPASVTVPAAASAGSFTVTTPFACGWTAVSNAAWLVPSPASGAGTTSINYSVAANPGGQRSGTITVEGHTFTVTQSGLGPAMSVNPASLRFAATNSGTMLTAQTGAQTVRIGQTGTGTVTWRATANQPWLTVSPGEGTGPATLTIGVAHHPSLPPNGASVGSITLTFTGAGSGPPPLAVTLTTIPNGTSAVPFGSFDTPQHGATGVSGSVALTGWVLDDLDVTGVRIFMSTVANECRLHELNTPTMVFIGQASMVEGARPDIVTAYPNHPRNTRAGWGYMLLTNFLPGDGAYTLCAVADDAEGRSALLTSPPPGGAAPVPYKSMAVANATAIKPFGAIDTPRQGQIISGTSFLNWGWVLAHGEHGASPPDGGTVTVYINSAAEDSPPVGWTGRPDINLLFPSFEGRATAVGVHTFNPQALGEGVYTIAWGVTDTNGQTAGVGSRFFTVTAAGEGGGGTTTSLAAPALQPLAVANQAMSLASHVNGAPDAARPLRARRGFDLSTPFTPVARDAGGRDAIEAEEMDRVEVDLGAGGGTLTGYMRVGKELGPLPIGSRLNAGTGTFGWQPGVGFVGRYDLVFVRTQRGRVLSRQEVTIALHPTGSNRVGPQVMIDTPAADAVVSGSSRTLTVAGWALDLDDGADTGVTTVHVWTYPIDALTGARVDPAFLGVAAYGGERPDVAATFGDRYLRSGYGLTVDHLEPGTYDVAVFAWSSVRRGFVPAKVVRVTVR
jgi:hypothetical protein